MKSLFLGKSDILAVVLLAACAAGIMPATAAVTTAAWYRMGDNDPNAAMGVTGKYYTADCGSNMINLLRQGAPTYSTNVPTDNPPGSALSMLFNLAHSPRDCYYVANSILTNLDNFGMEAYVNTTNPSPPGVGTIIVNGSIIDSGISLVVREGAWAVFLGGVAWFDSAISNNELNAWVRVAVVRDNGTTKLYVNGVQRGSVAGTPNPHAGLLSIGYDMQAANYGFDGRIDEVRVFTFQPGAFNPATDLTYPGAPDPVHATVINKAWYRLGENDPNAASGATGNYYTVDLGTNNINLVRYGTPTYSADASGDNPPNSTLSMKFDATNSPYDYYAIGSSVLTNLDNFGLEAYVKTTNRSASANGAIVMNGHLDANGMGLFVCQGNWAVIIAQQFLWTWPIQDDEVGTWVRVAVIRTNGAAQLYVNGAPRAAPYTNVPYANSGQLSIGYEPLQGSNPFDGLIDEVRVFTFTGVFNPAIDLGYPVAPAPTHATVTTRAWHRLGENDSFASAGATGNLTTVCRGSPELSLTRYGSPRYSSDTPGSDTNGSTLSMLFDPAHSPHDVYILTNSTLTNLDNFGIETYVKTTNRTDNALLVENGSDASSGISLIIYMGYWTVELGGVGLYTDPNIIPDSELGAWVHFAAVRENGTFTLYINGAARTSFTATPKPNPTGQFRIGRTAGNYWPFDGRLDEVRLFTFTGHFNPPIDFFTGYPPPPPTGAVMFFR